MSKPGSNIVINNITNIAIAHLLCLAIFCSLGFCRAEDVDCRIRVGTALTNAEISRKHALELEERKIEVVGRLAQLSSSTTSLNVNTGVSVGQSNRNNASVKAA